MAEHDSGYKLLFSYSRMVEHLLRGFVRLGWVEDLDFTTLERVNESFTSDGMEQRHADMVWRAQSKSEGKEWVYVFFILEFQSTSNPFMAVRLLSYVALLYSGLVRAKAVTPEEGLPAVVSVVLYNGKRPWRAPTDLASLYRSVPPGCMPYLPQLTYILIDENRLTPEELALDGNRVAALFRVETLQPEGLPDLKPELTRLLPRKDEDPELRRALLRWIQRLLRRLLPGVTIPDDDFEEMPMLEETLIEWRDTARREGLREGRMEGRKEGRQKGQIEGKRQFLLQLLEQRFGALSPQVRRKVKVSTEKRLEELGMSVLVAGSLAEMGLE